MAKFKVGDVCVLCSLVEVTKDYANGDECEVVGPLQDRKAIDGRKLLAYRIHVNGQTRLAEERFLRLRRPPSWDSWLYDTKDVERESYSPTLKDVDEAREGA